MSNSTEEEKKTIKLHYFKKKPFFFLFLLSKKNLNSKKKIYKKKMSKNPFHVEFKEVPDFWDSDYDGSLKAAKLAMKQRQREQTISITEIKMLRDEVKLCYAKHRTNYKKECSSMVKQYLLRIKNRDFLPRIVRTPPFKKYKKSQKISKISKKHIKKFFLSKKKIYYIPSIPLYSIYSILHFLLRGILRTLL